MGGIASGLRSEALYTGIGAGLPPLTVRGDAGSWTGVLSRLSSPRQAASQVRQSFPAAQRRLLPRLRRPSTPFPQDVGELCERATSSPRGA